MWRGSRKGIAGAGLVIGLLLSGVSAPAAEAAAPVWFRGRVMTWNVNAGGPEGPEFDAAEIARKGPELVGVQESCKRDVEDMVYELRDIGLYYYVAYGTVRDFWKCGGAFGQAILSRFPITYNPARDNVRYSQGGRENRGYMVVTTKVNGVDTTVFNTHLAARDDAPHLQPLQVRELLERASTHSRAIVLGDFNNVPPSGPIREMWRYFKDADPACHPDREPLTDNGEPEGCQTTLTNEENPKHKRKFDYIFLRGFTQTGVGVTNSPASDHHLVYSILRE